MWRGIDTERELQVSGFTGQSNDLRDGASGFKGGKKPDGADGRAIHVDLVGASLAQNSEGERLAMLRDLEMEAEPVVARGAEPAVAKVANTGIP
jgi:hypothetical protein